MRTYRTIRKNSRDRKNVNSATQEDEQDSKTEARQTDLSPFD